MSIASSNRAWNWHGEGFIAPPREVWTARPLTLFRVWGGSASEAGSAARPGVCMSFEVPRSRRDAERLNAVFEWGNNCRYLTRFHVAPGAKLFVGKVHPGDSFASGLGPAGSQVFIETSQMRRFVRKTGQAVELADDMGRHVVVPNRDPGKLRSS